MNKEKKEEIINFIANSQSSFLAKLATMLIHSDLAGDEIEEIMEVTSIPEYQKNMVFFAIKFDDQFIKNYGAEKK
jgi:hypothetical protein